MRKSAELIKGDVNYPSFANYPSIKALGGEYGQDKTIMLVTTIIQDFVSSMNVVRSMSEGQIAEAAIYLVDAAADFVIEDYVAMFALAKRGKIGNILDRIDIEVIGEIHNEYLGHRQRAFRAAKEATKLEKIKVIADRTYTTDASDAIGDAIKKMKDLATSNLAKPKPWKVEDDAKDKARRELWDAEDRRMKLTGKELTEYQKIRKDAWERNKTLQSQYIEFEEIKIDKSSPDFIKNMMCGKLQRETGRSEEACKKAMDAEGGDYDGAYYWLLKNKNPK